MWDRGGSTLAAYGPDDLAADSDQVYAFTRTNGDDTILVVIKDQQKIVPIVEKLKSLLD